MRLHPAAREFYTLRIETDPPAVDVEASFDGGVNWHAGESTTATIDDSGTPVEVDVVRWLVAGPDAELGAAARVAKTVTVLLRWPDDPEQVVRPLPDELVVSPNAPEGWSV